MSGNFFRNGLSSTGSTPDVLDLFLGAVGSVGEIGSIANSPPTPQFSGKIKVSEWIPKVDVRESKDSYLVQMELPGVKADHGFSVTIKQGTLTICGEKKLDDLEGYDKNNRNERLYGQFVRTFSLPSKVVEDDVDAELKDGVLTLKIKKADEEKPKKVKVKVS